MRVSTLLEARIAWARNLAGCKLQHIKAGAPCNMDRIRRPHLIHSCCAPTRTHPRDAEGCTGPDKTTDRRLLCICSGCIRHIYEAWEQRTTWRSMAGDDDPCVGARREFYLGRETPVRGSKRGYMIAASQGCARDDFLWTSCSFHCFCRQTTSRAPMSRNLKVQPARARRAFRRPARDLPSSLLSRNILL